MEPESNISILSITALNQMVHDLLEECFAEIWVEGEISNLVQANSGHSYFSLKDKEAQVRCAFFKGSAKFSPCSLQNGMHVLVKARVSLYAPRGDYQLIVSRVQEMGDGALQRAFETLKKKLQAQGLFDPQFKKPLPSYPKKIGVVTSPTGAAIRDILHVCARRFPATELIIYPTLVQGKQAAKQIAQMIELANQHHQCDILIVGRGGGSLEDLWSFNEEIVAHAIFKSTIPIISAVGHEIDFTIADFVADVRAPTPSAAAELVTPDSNTLINYFLNAEQLLYTNIIRRLTRCEEKRHFLSRRLTHPHLRLQQHMQRVDELHLRLHDHMAFLLERKKQKLVLLMNQLHTLSPLATLERGYTIVKDTQTQRLIHSTKDVTPQQSLDIQFVDGSIIAIAT